MWKKKTSSNMQKCVNFQLFHVIYVALRTTCSAQLSMTCYVIGIKHIQNVCTAFLAHCKMFRHHSWSIVNYLILKCWTASVNSTSKAVIQLKKLWKARTAGSIWSIWALLQTNFRTCRHQPAG